MSTCIARGGAKGFCGRARSMLRESLAEHRPVILLFFRGAIRQPGQFSHPHDETLPLDMADAHGTDRILLCLGTTSVKRYCETCAVFASASRHLQSMPLCLRASTYFGEANGKLHAKPLRTPRFLCDSLRPLRLRVKFPATAPPAPRPADRASRGVPRAPPCSGWDSSSRAIHTRPSPVR